MKFYFRTLISTVLFFSCSASAFNWDACRAKRIEIYDRVGPFVAPISTGQFTSSTGECAAIGMNSKKEAILQFVAVNSESLIVDFARKSGENLETLQYLANLTEDETQRLSESQEAKNALVAERYEDFYELMVRL